MSLATTDELRINGARVVRELQELAEFCGGEPPGVTRVVYTDADQRARKWLKGLCAEANLTVREDGCGNLFARWEGSDPDAPAIGTGSHCDAIPNSGIYDGTVGVLGGLEAIRALQARGFEPKRSIELLMFTSEEPTRFGIGCLGSRLLGGVGDPGKLAALCDEEETSAADAARSAGFSGDFAGVKLPSDYYRAFVELHIEQGPLLERDNTPIGIVTAIAAPASLRITFHGEGGHAGTVLMPERRDALIAAAELALAVERTGRTNGSPDTVATTGVFRPFPGAVNSIPSRCVLEIDIRDTSGEARDRAANAVCVEAERIARERSLTVDVETINSDPPAACAAEIIEAAKDAAVAEKLAVREMVSRAYHDSLFMAQVAPTGMIFIPCRDGISHRPEEFASEKDIAAGVTVLARTLATLSHAGG